MRIRFGKILCLLMSMLVICSCFAGNVFAVGEYAINVKYDSSLGNVELNVNSVETAAANIDYDDIWKASASLKAGTSVKIMDGITITPAEDFAYTKSSAKFNSVEFNGYVKGTNNGNVTASGASGVVFRIDAQRTGTIYFAVTLADKKGVKAVNVKDIGTPILEYTNNTGSPVNDMTVCSFDIKAGESYYFWPVGTKPQTYGAVFKEKLIVNAPAGNTVTVKSTPKSGNYIGNVKLGDENIALEKNDGMTECSFVMPESDVELTVDFIPASVNDEIQKISFDEIKGANTSASEVYDNLALFDGYNVSTVGYADVSWESSDESIVSKSGDVNALGTDTQVDITAVFTWQDYPNLRLTKTFNLTVPADKDDDAAVASARDALTLGDTSAVKKNLELPAKGRRNTSITWKSSNTDIVGDDGAVSPVWERSSTVTLTATISRGEAVLTKEFTITVPAQYALTVDRIAVSNADGDVVMTPMDGGYLSHIVITDNIINKNDEVLLAAVYNAKGSALLSAGIIKMSELTTKQYSENNGQKIIYLDKLDIKKIPVFDNCIIKVFAFDSIAGIKPATSQNAYVYKNDIVSKPTVYVAGDSTACTYSAKGSNNRFPQTGWAAVLGDYFSGATVKDLALSGRSSLDFRKETNYSTIKNGIKSGDYFIIQFGHNDSKNEPARYTDPSGDRFTSGSYKNSLTEYYVNIALDKGANPILTTSISRRRTSDAGLEAYVNATKQLGYELGLPVVDLYSKVNGYINEVGAEQAKDLYNYVKAKDSRFSALSAGEFSKSQYYANGTTDDTHINYYGAQMISQWFCDELERLGHPLTQKRNTHSTKLENIPSYASATSK